MLPWLSFPEIVSPTPGAQHSVWGLLFTEATPGGRRRPQPQIPARGGQSRLVATAWTSGRTVGRDPGSSIQHPLLPWATAGVEMSSLT